MFPEPDEPITCPENSRRILSVLPKIIAMYDSWCDSHENTPVCFGIEAIIDALNDSQARYKVEKPAQDFDRDLFSGVSETLRGTWWKGKDCSGTDFLKIK